MNLCSDGHEEVAHEGRDCPVCTIIAEHKEAIDELKGEKEEKENKLEQVQDELKLVQEELDEYLRIANKSW